LPDREPVPDVFVGRTAERARLSEAIARVRTGQAWLVTIEGDSGIGKTALARQALSAATGFTVLAARADPNESDLDFGIVDQLVRRVSSAARADYPLLDGAATGGSASPFAVGAQLLALIGAQQARTPLAIIIDDVQWADRRSVEALTFVLRRLTVDPVLVIAVFRGERDRLDDQARRMVASMEHRLRISLSGLGVDDVVPLAHALGAGDLSIETVRRLYHATGGHALYLQMALGDGLASKSTDARQVPPSLAAAIADQLATLPPETRAVLEMLSVANVRLPLTQLGDATGVTSASQAIEPAVNAGFVDWWPLEPSCPVELRHALQREAIYAGIPAHRRRTLHARAATLVDESSAWGHRVAALDQPDDALAAELEDVAANDAARGRLPLAATHLLWAAEISPARSDREHRMLTAANLLMVSDEARGLELLPAIESAAPSPLRSCVLGTVAFAGGRLGEAEFRFTDAFEQARTDPAKLALSAVIASRLAGTYTVLGQGAKVMEFGRWAVATGTLDAAAESTTRTLIAIGSAQAGRPRDGLAAMDYLDPDPSHVHPVHVDGLAFRGIFRLTAGELPESVRDLRTSVQLARQGAIFTLGLRGYFALTMAQYLTGAWDDALLTADQAFSAAGIHARRYEIPSLQLAAGCVLAGRGASAAAERHAELADQAAESLDYGQERLYAAMLRALVGQASGDYAAMTAALGPWQDESVVDGRTQLYGVLWRPLLIEGYIGLNQPGPAAVALERLREHAGDVSWLQPGFAWLDGRLTELQGRTDAARRSYEQGEAADTGVSPIYSARLLLAHGRLLRRTGARRAAVERLRRANALFAGLRAAPFIAEVEAELAECGLTRAVTSKSRILEMTARETEVAHLVGRGMTNAEIAAELFVTPKAVAYHLGNIYAKFGLKGRQQLRRFLADPRQFAAS
jgi:DNA-binding CsgD family transcriptional regulator